MKWDVLLAAGEDLDNVMKEAGIVTEVQQKVPEVPYRSYRPEIPRGANGDPPGQEEQQEQQHVPEVPELVPTPWEEGLKMIRDTISKFLNPIM